MSNFNRNIILSLVGVFIISAIGFSLNSNNKQPINQVSNEYSNLDFSQAKSVDNDPSDTSISNNQNEEIVTSINQHEIEKVNYDKKLKKIENELLNLKSNINNLLKSASTLEDNATSPEIEQQLSSMSEQHEQLAYDYIENTFSNEPVDTNWEAEVSSKILDGLSSIKNVNSSDVKCATTMCRITASVEGEDNNSMSMMHSLDDQIDWQGQMTVTINHKTGEMTAFLVRPGNELPEVSQ